MKRVRYNKGNLESAIQAAQKIFNGTTLYIFATGNGYTIENRQPPFGLRYVEVK